MDPLCVLLFQGLWLMADREGRLEDRPLRICAELFPYRDRVTAKRVDAMLDTLKGHGFIVRYEMDTSRLIQVVGFKKHQNPHKSERESVLPAYQALNANSHCASTVQAQESHGNKPEVVGLTPSSLTPDSLTPSSPQSGAAHLPASKKATYVAARNPELERREEGKRMWPRVLAAIQAADLQRSFPQDGDVQRAVRQIGGWQRLGQKNRDLRGQTEQEFLNAYASLRSYEPPRRPNSRPEAPALATTRGTPRAHPPVEGAAEQD
jgi:hypothetical protein